MLDVPPHVLVREVDVAVELQILAFHEERRSGGQAVAVDDVDAVGDLAAG